MRYRRNSTLRQRQDGRENHSHHAYWPGYDTMPRLLTLETVDFVEFLADMEITVPIGRRGARLLGGRNRPYQWETGNWERRVQISLERSIADEIRSATVSVGFDDLPDPSYEDDFVDDGDDYRDDPGYMEMLEVDEVWPPEPDYGERSLECITITLDGDTSLDSYYEDSGFDYEEVEPQFDDEYGFDHLPLRNDLIFSLDTSCEGLEADLAAMGYHGELDMHELYGDGLCPVHVYHALQNGVLLGSNDDINHHRSPRAFWPVIEAA